MDTKPTSPTHFTSYIAKVVASLLIACVLAVGSATTSTQADAAGTLNNVIVKQSQNPSNPTAWLLVNGKRYWIPSGAIFECLRAAGVGGPVLLSNAELDARPDQTGQHASCGSGNNPRGNLDVAAESSGGSLALRGWATDPNVRTAPVEIHVYVGGPAGTAGAEGHNLGYTNAYRPDVNTVFPGDGNYHGFDTRITTAKRGTQTVCAYAINQGPGANVLLGCRTVTVFVDPYLLPPPFPAGTYGYPLNNGVCALVDQTKYPNSEIYHNFSFQGLTADAQFARCKWLAQTQGDEAGIPAGAIVPLMGILTTTQACTWMTGEAAVVVNGQVRCLWTKGRPAVVQADGRYV